MKKTEVLHNFFSSVCIGNHFFFKALNLSPGTGGRRTGREDQVQDHVKNMSPRDPTENVELSAPSKTLQITPNSVVPLVCLGEEISCRGTLTGNWAHKNFMRFNKAQGPAPE